MQLDMFKLITNRFRKLLRTQLEHDLEVCVLAKSVSEAHPRVGSCKNALTLIVLILKNYE